MIKKFAKPAILSILALSLVALPVLAAYTALIQIVTTTVSYDMFPLVADVDNDQLVTQNYISSTGLDTRVKLAGTPLPHMLASDKTLFASSLIAAGSSNFYLWTEEAPLSAFDILAGYFGYETITDDATLELGNEFEIDQKGYVETSDSNFVHLDHKQSAYSTSITDTSEISGIVYFDEPQELFPVVYNAWDDVDVGDYVPAHATGVVVHLTNDAGAAREVGVRINGSVNTLSNDLFYHSWTIVGIDANDIFEVYLEDTDCHCYLAGFTGSDFTFKAVADDVSLGVAVAWTDIDLSAEAPDATGVIIVVKDTGGAPAPPHLWGVRKKGSGDARTATIPQNGVSWAVIGCDTNQVIEGYVVDLATEFHLVGYTTANVTLFTNGIDKSLAAGFGMWSDVDCSGDVTGFTTHIIFEVTSDAVREYGFRRNGSTEDIHYDIDLHFFVVVECDENQIVQGWAEANNVDWWIIGYVEGYIDSPIERQAIATGVAAGEHTIVTSISDDVDFDDWATDASVAVNVGSGLLPVMLLETQELTATTATVTFSNIDTLVGTWDTVAGVTSRHLVVVVNAASPSAIDFRDIYFQLSGDTGANYNVQELKGVGAGASAAITTSTTAIQSPWIPGTNYADAFGGGVILIPHAFNTTNHKATLSFGGSVEYAVLAFVGRWANISAVTSVQFLCGGGDQFAAGSTFWLGVVDERYLVEEEYDAGADFLPVFDSIPQDGSDLVVIGYCRTTQAAVVDQIIHEINDDGVAANYWRQDVNGVGVVTSAASVNHQQTGETTGDNATANAFGAFVATYSQYAETANDVTAYFLGGYHESTGATSYVSVYGTRWDDVAQSAITKLEYIPNAAPDFKAGSLFSLYRVPRYVIERVELTALTPTIHFTNIPQGYGALQLLVYARTDAGGVADWALVEINGDNVDANYDQQTLDGTGAVVTAARISGLANSRRLVAVPDNAEGANEFGGGIITFPSYSKTDRHKHWISIYGRQENCVYIQSSRWENTDPIDEIELVPDAGGNFVIGTIVELVGIMPDSLFTINIDGGDVEGVSDGNVTVNDNDWDWKLNQDNVMPYMEYYQASGQALHFPRGVTSNVDFTAIHNAAPKLTISFWFNPYTDYSAGSGTQYIFGKRIDATHQLLVFLSTASGRLHLSHDEGGLLFEISSIEASWVANTWYHVIVSISSAEGAALMIDGGIPVTDADVSAAPDGGTFAFGDYVLGGGLGFIGEIKDIVVFTDDLTTAEEAGLYAGIIPSDANNIWYMDEGTGVNIIDYGTDGDDGTAGVACTWQGGGTLGNTLGRAYYQPITIVANTSYDGEVDGGGSTTSLIDSTLTQPNDYWNLALITITGAGAAPPEGETSVVYNFDAATDQLYFSPALSAGLINTDTYTVEFGTLVDRGASPQDARITWGVNPSDMSYTVGSFISTEIVIPTTVVDTQDILPTGAPVALWGMAAPVNAYSDIVNSLAASANVPAVVMWVTICMIIVIATMLGLYMAFKDVIVPGIFGGFLMIGFSVVGVLPKWAILLAIIIIALPVLTRREA